MVILRSLCANENFNSSYHITGHIAYKLCKKKIDCKNCIEKMLENTPHPSFQALEIHEGVILDNSERLKNEKRYLELLNRGGLKRPSYFLYYMVKICLGLFDLKIKDQICYFIKKPEQLSTKKYIFPNLETVRLF